MSDGFDGLQAVLDDKRFPEVDHRLRTGQHIDLDDVRAYELLVQGEPHLTTFYDRYDCRLVHAPEGYYYLLSGGTLLGQRRLTAADMIVGQVLALMFLNPAQLRTNGRVELEQVLVQLELILSQDRLARVLAPRSRGRDRETDNRKVRELVARAVNNLERLGFVSQPREYPGEVLIRRPIWRFVDPVRRPGDPTVALQELIRQGAVSTDVDVRSTPASDDEEEPTE